MEISKYDLLKLTQTKSTVATKTEDNTEELATIYTPPEKLKIVGGNHYDSIVLNGNVVDLVGNISDAELENIYAQNTSVQTYNTTKFATSYKSFTPSEMHRIKELIYNIHKNGVSGATGGTTIGGITGGTTGGTTAGSPNGGTTDGTTIDGITNGGTTDGTTTGGTNEGTTDGTTTGGTNGGTTDGTTTGGTNGGTTDGTTTDGTNGGTTDGTTTGGTNGGTTDGTTTDGTTGDSSNKVPTSFLDEFGDTETMFEWLHMQNPSISYETGITRAQLVALTQDDDWEDSHYDFFGCLNRIFNVLDKDDDSILSAAEIEEFIGEELGDSVLAYQREINTYAKELQTYYEGLSDQEKLEFAIERTREYFEAAGMTRQLKALERMLKETDSFNTVKVGQIAMTEFADRNDGYITLGAYTSANYTSEYEDSSEPNKPYSTGYFATDSDTNQWDADLGLTLNISLLDENWYELVNVLVHEITHSTAYQYEPTLAQVKEFYNSGYISETEYNYYSTNWNSLIADYNTNGSNEYIDKLIYLITCQWGEYAAYQADADYNDSIGADVLDAGMMTTAVDGSEEKDTIIDHIESAYNNTSVDKDDSSYHKEALPSYKWWSYA
jgi:hypothetical protein